jgi:large subunit ribosomal protein L24
MNSKNSSKHLIIGTPVIVIAGAHKGMTGNLKARKGERVFVEGVNLVKYNVKHNQKQHGGIQEKEASVHVSNVAFYDEKNEKKAKLKVELGPNKKDLVYYTDGKQVVYRSLKKQENTSKSKKTDKKSQ